MRVFPFAVRGPPDATLTSPFASISNTKFPNVVTSVLVPGLWLATKRFWGVVAADPATILVTPPTRKATSLIEVGSAARTSMFRSHTPTTGCAVEKLDTSTNARAEVGPEPDSTRATPNTSTAPVRSFRFRTARSAPSGTP